MGDVPRLARRAVVLGAPWYFVPAGVVAARFGRRPAAVGLGVYAAAYGVALVAGAIAAPWSLAPIGGVALAVTAVGRWWSRPTAGTARGLPPGRLPLVNLAAVVEREHVATEARRYGPVFKMISPSMPSPTVCVVGLARGAAVLREHDGSLAPVGHPFDPLIPGGLLRHMTGDTHRRYRRILHDALDDRVVAAHRGGIEAIVAAALGGLVAGSDDHGVDPRATLEDDLVLPALIELFFGLAPSDPVATRMRTLFGALDDGTTTRLRGDALAAAEGVARELDAIVLHLGTATSSGGPDASFLAAMLGAHPTALDDPVVLRNLVFTVKTSVTDLAGLLHWCTKMLADHPRWIEALRTADDAGPLADRIVMETLRLEQSELLYRYTREEIRIEGATVPAHWLVRIGVRESHRDPAVFADPDRFDPDRFHRRFSRTEYAPLGMQSHTCLGAGVVAAVARAYVEGLARHHDLTVASDGRPVFAIHWRPSRRFRIRLRHRVDALAPGPGGGGGLPSSP